MLSEVNALDFQEVFTLACLSLALPPSQKTHCNPSYGAPQFLQVVFSQC